MLSGKKRFNPQQCRTRTGTIPRGQRSVSLLQPFVPHLRGSYTRAYEAKLSDPYFVELRDRRTLSHEQRSLLEDWPGTNVSWHALARQLRSG